MIAVILVAGKGRRIAELTNGQPKSFLLLGKRRIIDHQLHAISQISVEKIVLVTGYRSDLFENEYGDRGFILLKNPFYANTNVLASLWFAREFLSEGFYFMHGDTYFEPIILEKLEKQPGAVVLAVEKKATVPEDMKVRVKDHQIVEINKEMPSETAYGEFTGLAKVTPPIASRVVELIEERIEIQGDHNSFFEVVLQDLIDEGTKITPFNIGKHFSIEIDFPEDYVRAKKRYHEIET